MVRKATTTTKSSPVAPAAAPVAESKPEVLAIVDTKILPSAALIRGNNTITLTQGDFQLRVFQDNTINTFVTYHKDVILAVLRGHRRTAVTTFGLHISSIVRLAVNVNEEAASSYLAAAAFFDNNLRAFTAKMQHVVDLQYTHTEDETEHHGYVFLAGKNVAYDDDIPPAAQENIFRAMAYVKNFCDRYHSPDHENELVLPTTAGDLKW